MQQLRNLKWMDLSDSRDLKELPSSIEKLTSLQILDLRDCSSLVKLPPSINANNLQELSLRNCSRVVELPAIENATNLRELKLQNCSSLIELPLSIGTATNLKQLNISGCSSLVKLPSSIGDITDLEVFDLSNCSSLVTLPSSIGNLQNLCKLIMRGCSKLEALPININLKFLDTLNLAGCSQLKSFPEISTKIFTDCYQRMSRLRDLSLNNCNNLVSLPQLSDSLDYIYADNCKSLERLDCCFNNPEIRLYFPKCFKLNQEARDLIMHTCIDAMFPGTQVPACFIHRATSGDSLKIKLKESPLPTTLRFKACIMLVKVNEEMSYDQRSMSVDIVISVHQAIKVQCTPSYHHIYPVLTEHIYTFELEVEEVTSTELVFEFILDKESNWKRNWKIGECGILQRETRSLRRSSSPDLSPESSRVSSYDHCLRGD